MKNASFSRLLQALIVCAASLVWVSPPVWAQVVPNKPGTEAVPATPLAIDPLAVKAFQELVARYKNLRSYADLTTRIDNGELKWSAQTMWARPGRAIVAHKEGDIVQCALSNGGSIYLTNSQYPGYYEVQPPSMVGGLLSAFAKTHSLGIGFALTTSSPGYSFEDMQKSGLQILHFDGEETVDGVLTRLITLNFNYDNAETSTTTYYIGVEDGLIHQITEAYTRPWGTSRLEEKHAFIHINPDFLPETWTWIRPAGSRQVSSLRNIENDPYYRFDQFNKPLPPFEAIDMEGKKVFLADYQAQNKIVLLHFSTL